MLDEAQINCSDAGWTTDIVYVDWLMSNTRNNYLLLMQIWMAQYLNELLFCRTKNVELVNC